MGIGRQFFAQIIIVPNKKNGQFRAKIGENRFGFELFQHLVPLIAALFMKAAALRLFFLVLSFTVVKKYKYRFDTHLTLESHSSYQCGSKLTLADMTSEDLVVAWSLF